MDVTVNGQQTYIYTGTQPLVAEQPSIVFIHGAGMDHSVWILQSRYFAHHGRNVLALDLPGHGRSAGAALASIGAMVDWLEQLLAALPLAPAQPVSLVGHSMGALVALAAAARYPQRVQRAALLGVAMPMTVSPVLLAAAEANEPAAIDMITVWGHSPSAQLGGNRVPGLWLTGGGKRLLERAAAGVLYTDLSACNGYQDGLSDAAQIRCPILLLLGQRDQMTPPRATRDLAAALARHQVEVRSVVVPGSGHMMCAEKPDETLDALIDFLL